MHELCLVYQDEVVVVLTLLLLPYDPARPAQLDRVYDRGCVVQATECHVSVYACSLRTERRSECRTAAAAAAQAAEIVAMQHLGPHEAARYARTTHRPYHLYACIQT
jgi:hypothetical protein